MKCENEDDVGKGEVRDGGDAAPSILPSTTKSLQTMISHIQHSIITTTQAVCSIVPEYIDTIEQ